MQIAISTKREYAQLWKVLVKEEPEIALRLANTYLVPFTPMETDLLKVPAFFTSFCTIQNISPEQYRGALYKSSKIDQRRLFIAAIIRLYDARTRLLVKTLSETLQQHHPAIIRLIQEVEFRYKACDDFRLTVDTIVHQLRGGQNGAQ